MPSVWVCRDQDIYHQWISYQKLIKSSQNNTYSCGFYVSNLVSCNSQSILLMLLSIFPNHVGLYTRKLPIQLWECSLYKVYAVQELLKMK